MTEKLHQAGLQVFVLCRRIQGLPRWRPAEGIPITAVPSLGSRSHDLEEKTFGNFLISFSFSLSLLAALIRFRRDYDLVHFHGASLPLIVNVLFLKVMGKKIVAKVAGAKMNIEAGSFRNTHLLAGNMFIRILKHVDAFVAISDEIMEDLTKDGFVPEKICRIPNFVLPDHFYPPRDAGDKKRAREKIGIRSDAFVVTFSGRLVQRKRVDILLHAVAEVVSRGNELRVLILGHGEMRSKLEQMAAELGIEGRVSFTSFVTNILDYLHASDLFIFPSVKEGMPNALLEAMACGLPVIATRIGGVVDVIRDRDNGLLVSPGNAGELRDALLLLLESPEIRTAISARAGETIRQYYHIDSVAERYLALYREVMHED